MPVQTVLVPAFIGLIVGAVCVPLIVYLGIRFNYKRLRTLYAHIIQDTAFYKAYAATGGALGAAWGAELPILDFLGIKDPWYGLVMIATGALIWLPLALFLKRHRRA